MTFVKLNFKILVHSQQRFQNLNCNWKIALNLTQGLYCSTLCCLVSLSCMLCKKYIKVSFDWFLHFTKSTTWQLHFCKCKDNHAICFNSVGFLLVFLMWLFQHTPSQSHNQPCTDKQWNDARDTSCINMYTCTTKVTQHSLHGFIFRWGQTGQYGLFVCFIA